MKTTKQSKINFIKFGLPLILSILVGLLIQQSILNSEISTEIIRHPLIGPFMAFVTVVAMGLTSLISCMLLKKTVIKLENTEK